jgi:hypothetical protein
MAIIKEEGLIGDENLTDDDDSLIIRTGVFRNNEFAHAVGIYSTQDSRNTITWDSIDRVEGEVLGDELVVDGVLSITPTDGEVYRQELDDGTVSYFIGDNASTTNLSSVKQVTSYTKLIGTASVASHYDISGNSNAISQTTSTMQCEFDSELGTWSWDGMAASAITALTPTPTDDAVISKIYKVVEVLGGVVGKAKDNGGTK